MSSALNGSSAIRRFKGSNAIEIRDGITFNFYTGLPHVYWVQNACNWMQNVMSSVYVAVPCEIEGYSIAYFDHIAACEVPYC